VLYQGKCFGILQFYICLAVFAFSFHSHSSVCVFYTFVTRESPSVSSLWCYITQNSESACSRTP